MKRFACHYLYASADGCYSKYVVELKEDGTVGTYFPLKEEICSTQWIGGVILLSPYSELKVSPGDCFASFLKKAVVETDEPLYAWHIADFDFAGREFKATSRLLRLR